MNDYSIFLFFLQALDKRFLPFSPRHSTLAVKEEIPPLRTRCGKAATKRIDSAQGHARTIKIPPAPLCKGGLGGFQRIFSRLDFLNEILRSCTIAVESNFPLASHKSSCYRNSLLLLPFLSHIGGSGYPFIWPGTSLTCGFQEQTSPKPQKAGSTVIGQFFC